jgi:outer membrane protein assembly factor BamB
MTERRHTRRALLAGLGAAAAGAAAGCAAPSKPRSTDRQAGNAAANDDDASATSISLSEGDAWSTYGYEPGHTGFNPDAKGIGSDASQAWEAGVEGIYTLREPAVAGGRLYVGSKETMYAFDAATGEDEWTAYLGGMTHHFAPTFRDGTLYAVSKAAGGVDNGASGNVQAIDAASGRVTWSRSVPATTTVAHDGSQVYVAGKEGGSAYVRALDPASGERGWRFDVADADRSSVTGTPACARETVYAPATLLADDGSTAGRLYALDPADGSPKWSVGTEGALSVAPVATDDRVYLAARDGTIHAVTHDGETAWTADAGASIYSRPTYADDRLFVVTTGDVVAVDDGGEEAWRAGSERTQMTGATVAGDTLYVGGEPLFALDTATGDARFELPVSDFHGAYGAPVAAGDALFVGICIKDEMGARYDNYVRAYS